MNTNLILMTLLVCSGFYGSAARAIDDVDNSIGVGGPMSASINFMARSRFGTQWVKFTVTPPEEIQQKVGAPLEIPCEVIGSRSPTVQWVVGPVPLSQIENTQSNVISDATNIATTKVYAKYVVDHILTQDLILTCVAQSGSKLIYTRTKVTPPSHGAGEVPIRGKAFTEISPRIVYSERMHLELMGSNVVLPCKVHAHPKAVVSWYNDQGLKIAQNPRYRFLPSGDLLISNLKWEDMGSYKCVATNALGSDQAEVFLYPVKRDDKKKK